MAYGFYKTLTIVAALLLLSASGLNRVKGEKCNLLARGIPPVELDNSPQSKTFEGLQEQEGDLPLLGGVSGMNLIFL